MVRHYTQLEIINLSKLPPTTVKRWLEYFSYFVPGTRQGDQVLYPYETLKLLKRISELRMERYHLSTIVRLLIEEGFPMYSKGEQELPVPERTESRMAEAPEPDRQQQLVASLSSLANELIRIADHLNHLKVQ
ncbi:MerR family transcriptional regulator [Paenibacillus silagei]|uniref:DNA-binding transcriptional MerR regulator n=1 Tax=Paenibacillus silagei TaxID=1670801 RepID=A0ABS4P227_9BACL|nr:MerR family transcriptional regulator [Paenibacillus silagei]MBP2116357.1 DNA-binding transcriptional MerR regulator [Paenibacillus silagei]